MEFFRINKMIKAVSFILLAAMVLALFPPSQASALSVPRITVDSPSAGSTISDYFSPRISVDSLDPVTNVYVMIGDQRFELAKQASVCSTNCPYGSVIDLSGFPRGTLNVVFHAVNSDGIDGDLSVSYTLNNPPTLKPATPLPFTVATPNIALSALCTDDEETGCRTMKASVKNGALLAEGVDSLNKTLDLSAYDGKKIAFQLEATDASGQVSSELYPLYVESNPKLIPVDHGNGLLLDADDTRIVYWDAYYHHIVIRDRETGAEEQLPLLVAQEWNLSVKLTPAGVIGTAWDATDSPYPIRDGYITNGRDPMGKFQEFQWSDGQITAPDLTGYTVSGEYAAYKRNDGAENALMISHLPTNEERQVDTKTTSDYQLTENGVLVYAKAGKIYRYSFADGDTKLISTGTGALYSEPYTDGDTVLYLKNNRDVIVWKDGQESVLTGADRSAYRAAGGWIAFVRLNGTGKRQFWVRTPQGEEQLLYTAKTASSRLDGLAPDGSVTFADNGSLFISRISAEGRTAPERLAPEDAHSFYRGGWQLFLGAAWYKLAEEPKEPEQPVDPVLTELALNVTSPLELKTGEKQALKVEGIYSDGKREDITLQCAYRSADESVAAVSASGELKAIGEGGTTIAITCGELTASIAVNVSAPEPAPTADLNGDGVVNLLDLIEFMRAFGTKRSASMHYDIRVDYDKNGVIDSRDAAVFMMLYQQRIV
ncbi:dockerin type I domain-containing protein [Paenibacillus sp. GCM10027626]|uniref:dockerin type I domain-containing protein n=1 Tax=Paenibacillus sp. GCM10027626 TaxID=3273411 RepID=UPI0036383B65